MTTKTLDYPAIRKWHKDTGSLAYYITAQVEKARADKAPADAIYKRSHIGGDGKWVTVRDLAPEHKFRKWYEEKHDRQG